MLDLSDTDTVKAWIASAFELGKRSGLDAKGLADRCGVTVQAVNGWKSTGRITKKNLEKATTYFGHGPSFTRAMRVEEPMNSGPAWPFRAFTLREIQNLKPKQLLRVEKLIRARLDEFAEDEVSSTAKRRAA